MSMVPSSFPDVEGLDMYASMTPAREVGGDLYSYLMKGDKLYFCVGDVSGKGVPASLFMAQATRLFHTLASQGMKPAEIATRMNGELAEDNPESMFIVWRKDVHRIALYTELGGLQIQLRAGIQTVDKRQKQFVTVNEHSLMQVNDIFGKIIWISTTVNT